MQISRLRGRALATVVNSLEHLLDTGELRNSVPYFEILSDIFVCPSIIHFTYHSVQFVLTLIQDNPVEMFFLLYLSRI